MGVLTQYQPLELNTYIGNGVPWDLDRSFGGVYVLPPYVKAEKGEWYKGTANAIYQNISFIQQFDPKYVLVLSGDHIYKMNYAKMLACHKEHNAAATVAVMPVPWEEAPRFGIMDVDSVGRIVEFEEKPEKPKSRYAVPGLYFYDGDAAKLAHTLQPSARGELEITALNELYLQQGRLHVELMARGMAWLDTGTPEGMLNAAQYVEAVQSRQGLYIACPEEIAWEQGFISDEEVAARGQELRMTEYGQYLLSLVK